MNISLQSPKRAKSINWLSALLLTIWVLLVSLAVETMGQGQDARGPGLQDRTAEQVGDTADGAGQLSAQLTSAKRPAFSASAPRVGG